MSETLSQDIQMVPSSEPEMLTLIHMTHFRRKKYVYLGFDGKWLASYGNATVGFLAIFWGNSGSGKTEAAMQLAKYLTSIGRVLYLSWEQKDRSTIQEAFKRNGLLGLKDRILLSPGGTLKAILNTLNTPIMQKWIKKGLTIFFDSVDYSPLTFADVTELRLLYPTVNLVFIAHGKGKEPKLAVAGDIKFDADMKCHVVKRVVFPLSRFGGEAPFIVHEEVARQYHPALFDDSKTKRTKKKK